MHGTDVRVLHAFPGAVLHTGHAHIFCLPEQEDEILGVIDLIRECTRLSGSMRYTWALDPAGEIDRYRRHVGDSGEGSAAALERAELPYVLNAGDGAFYGRRSTSIEDVMGRPGSALPAN